VKNEQLPLPSVHRPTREADYKFFVSVAGLDGAVSHREVDGTVSAINLQAGKGNANPFRLFFVPPRVQLN